MKKIYTLLLIGASFLATAQNNALDFDGFTSTAVADRVNTEFLGIPDSADRTIEMWIRRGTNNTAQGILTEWGNTTAGSRFTFKVQNNHLRIETGLATSALEGTTVIAANNWYHVAVVVDQAAITDKIKLYINGLPEAQASFPFNTDTSAVSAMRIGSRSNGVGAFDGAIDDLRVWNVARTQAEILAYMNGELCSYPASLVSYFKFNEGIAAGSNPNDTVTLDEVSPASVNSLTNMALTGLFSNFLVGNVSQGFELMSDTVAVCESYTWPVNAQTYTATGIYFDTIAVANGCDTVKILNFTNTGSPVTIIPVSSCGAYEWAQTGLTYAASGTYTDTLTNISGCDSVLQLNLTVYQSYNQVQTASDCGPYFWDATNQSYSASGAYTANLTAVGGCDSIITLNLSIGTLSFSFTQATGCNEFVWDADGNTYTASGIYDATIVNASGCDSIMALELTIDSVNLNASYDGVVLSAESSSDSYQWIDCSDNSLISDANGQNYLPTANGLYAVIVSTTTCSDTSECINVTNLGVANLNLTSMTVYPNPFNDVLTITFEGQDSRNIVVTNLQGQVVYRESNASASTLNLDFSDLDGGVYFIESHGSDKVETIKVIKN